MAGRADLHLDITIAHWIVGAHELAMALRALGQESEPEPMAKRGREGNRGDVALIVGAGRFRAFGNEVGACAQAILAMTGLRPTRVGREESISAGRAAMKWPMKSFLVESSLPRPRSCAVVLSLIHI